MAEPTQKSEGIETLIDSTLPEGRTRRGSIKQNICSWCGKPAMEFRDTLSRKEYNISGFCQDCQDKTFGTEEPEEPEVETITLHRPDWGYCVMKCLQELTNNKYSHLPMFCTAQEHGKGEPVTLRYGNGDEICSLDWDEFKKVYVID